MKHRLTAFILILTIVLTAGCSGEEPAKKATPEGPVLNGIGMEESVISDLDLSEVFTPSSADNARVFYQIFVGSFSDSNGDGIGDLRGVINRLDYLNDGDPKSGMSLGIEGIWLSPIFKSPSYHKYDVTDYYTIDPDFGTMDDLRELVSLCHERGIKVILDLVINHTGSGNEWFRKFCRAHREGDKADPYYDFYCYNDTFRLGSRNFTTIQGTSECYESNFSSDMPELNFEKPEVYSAVLDIARYYLTDVEVDGFRFDAAKYIYYGEQSRNVEFWKRFMTDLRQIDPDIYTVAEVWDGDSATIPYAEALNCFDFTMAQVDGMISSTTKRGDVNVLTNYVGSYLDRIHQLNSTAMIVPFISNHDMDRAAGYMTVASGYARMAANIYILGPGSPFIYYGEEIGLKGSRGSSNTDANRRLAMLWGDDDTVRNPIGTTFASDKQTNGTVAEQIGKEDSLYNYYKRLLQIRATNPEIARGKYTPLKFKDTDLGGFLSEYRGSIVGVFHNTTGSDITVDLSTVTDHAFTEIRAYTGVGTAALDGTVLTLGEQTSVVLR